MITDEVRQSGYKDRNKRSTEEEYSGLDVYVKRLKSAPLLLFVPRSIPSSTLNFSQKYMTTGLFYSRTAPTDARWSTNWSYIEHQSSHPRARLNFSARHLQGLC